MIIPFTPENFKKAESIMFSVEKEFECSRLNTREDGNNCKLLLETPDQECRISFHEQCDLKDVVTGYEISIDNENSPLADAIYNSVLGKTYPVQNKVYSTKNASLNSPKKSLNKL